jgi:hypothetical protein
MAKLKIKQNKNFTEPNWCFKYWLPEAEKSWAEKAMGIGTRRDSIIITLGRNNIYDGLYKKQNISAVAKINGKKITNKQDNSLSFRYNDAPNSNKGYYDAFEKTICKYLEDLANTFS